MNVSVDLFKKSFFGRPIATSISALVIGTVVLSLAYWREETASIAHLQRKDFERLTTDDVGASKSVGASNANVPRTFEKISGDDLISYALDELAAEEGSAYIQSRCNPEDFPVILSEYLAQISRSGDKNMLSEAFESLSDLNLQSADSWSLFETFASKVSDRDSLIVILKSLDGESGSELQQMASKEFVLGIASVHGFEGAAEFLADEGIPSSAASRGTKELANAWMEGDPNSVMKWVNSLPDSHIVDAVQGMFKFVRTNDLSPSEKIITWNDMMSKADSETMEHEMLERGIELLADADPMEALKWVNELPEDIVRPREELLIKAVYDANPYAAIEYAQALWDKDVPRQRADSILTTIVHGMASQNPKKAADWILSFDKEDDVYRTLLPQALSLWVLRSTGDGATEAKEWARSIKDPELRSFVTAEIGYAISARTP